MVETVEQTQTLFLSAENLRQMNGWPDAMIVDYQAQQRSTIDLISANNNNAGDLEQVETDLADHIASDSQHGVLGNNVGSKDFAQVLIGGVVLLAAAVADAVDSTVAVDSPDATTAPVAYDQTDAQTAVALVNEIKSDVNTLVTDVNAALTQLNALMAAIRTSGVLNT